MSTSTLTTLHAENNLLDLEIVFDDAIREGNPAKAAAAEVLRFNAACSLTVVQMPARQRAW